MPTRAPFELDEWYHCYNRGVDKRIVFKNAADYKRFLLSLYVGNSKTPVHISNLKTPTFEAVLEDESLEREPFVQIGGFCLMPNHFHFILKEIEKDGIARFMQKVSTAYTMYFNKKYERTGSLFAGTFKSKHLNDDRYLKHAISYVHLNPAELFDPNWKQGSLIIPKVKSSLEIYPYSSLPAFIGKDDVYKKIIGTEVFDLFDELPSLDEMVTEAAAYYTDIKV